MEYKINEILSNWDPIGVGLPLALSEYEQYVLRLKPYLGDEIKLTHALINMLIEMGLDFDPSDSNHQKDVNQVLEKLLKLGENQHVA
ncbi:MAG: hypothetical protein IPN76_07495 [Saprospiraceae bacterium]|nr:hypothetical protein [Saprospiraceae bacterium]